MTRTTRFTRWMATADVLPDGRVLVTLALSSLPFGADVAATVLYASLRGVHASGAACAHGTENGSATQPHTG